MIHVVQRPPPRPNSSGSNGSSNSGSASAPPPPTRDVNSFVVGSFTLPSEILDPNQVQVKIFIDYLSPNFYFSLFFCDIFNMLFNIFK